MKHLKLFILLIILCFCSFTEFADTVNKTKSVPDGTSIVLNGDKKPSTRPRTPSLQIITCIYDNGELTIDFVLPEGMCDVVLTECSGAAMSYTIDSSDLTATVYVGTLTESEVELTTENGNTYSGILTAE